MDGPNTKKRQARKKTRHEILTDEEKNPPEYQMCNSRQHTCKIFTRKHIFQKQNQFFVGIIQQQQQQQT